MFETFSNSFLKDFDFDVLASKFGQKEFLYFKRDSIIYSENDPAENVHFILSGEVNLYRTQSNTGKALICKSARGDIIGLDDVLTGNHYLNTAYALCDVNIFSINRKDFRGILKKKDDFNLWALKYLSHRINSLSS